MNKKQLKKYLNESIMQQLEGKKRTKETQKYLNKVLKLEEKLLEGLPEKKKKLYNELTLQDALYSGSETCDEIKFAINFIVDLFSAFR